MAKDKHNTLLRNSNCRITGHLKKQQTLSLKLTQETNAHGKQFKLLSLNYHIRQPGRRKPEQVYYINLLKKLVSQEAFWGGTNIQTSVLSATSCCSSENLLE